MHTLIELLFPMFRLLLRISPGNIRVQDSNNPSLSEMGQATFRHVNQTALQGATSPPFRSLWRTSGFRALLISHNVSARFA